MMAKTKWSKEGMMLKLKLQYWGHLMRRVDSLEKTLMLGGIWGQEEKGTTEDEMAGWHHWLDGRESGWTLGVGDGQGGLACCDSWGRKESDTTERLNWTDWSEINDALKCGCLTYGGEAAKANFFLSSFNTQNQSFIIDWKLYGSAERMWNLFKNM